MDNQELLKIIKQINTKAGVDILQQGSSIDICSHIPTGVFPLDLASLGGIPENKITIFSGDPGTGKTTVALKTIGSFHRKYKDKFALYIATEDSFDPLWAAKHGVDNDRVLVLAQRTGEEIIDSLNKILKSEATDYIGLVIVDSIAGVRSKTY